MPKLPFSLLLLLLLLLVVWWLTYWRLPLSPGSDVNDFRWETIMASEEIKWTNCYANYQCARLKVPLDYSMKEGNSASIALIRVPSAFPAKSVSYRGPLLFNPGGPGSSGVDFIIRNGIKLASLLGQQFDIIGFDPRGIGQSIPRVTFFDSMMERAEWLEGELPDALNSSAEALPRAWARAQIIGQLAQEHDHGLLQYITTENIARDMLHIVEAYGFHKLQYWGFSWGTVLGVVFASLFPDRIGRMVLDGVIDPEDYYATLWFNNLTDTEKTLQYFFESCAKAGPRACTFWAPSPHAISRNLDSLYESIRTQPVPVYFGSSYGLVDYSMLRRAVFTALYSPYVLFQPLAEALSDLRSGDGHAIFTLVQRPRFDCKDSYRWFYQNSYEAGTALHCLDGDDVHDNVEQLQDFYRDMAKLSSLAELWAVIRIRCSGWRARPATRFKGVFHGNTSFPILFVANTADPVAPLAAARNATKAFPGSVLLTQDAPGHCSLSGPSLCTQNHIQRYLLDGQLPAPDIKCPVFEELFASDRSNNFTQSLQQTTLSAEDQDVYGTLRALSRSFDVSPFRY